MKSSRDPREALDALEKRVAALLERNAALEARNRSLTEEVNRLTDSRQAVRTRIDALLDDLGKLSSRDHTSLRDDQA